MKKLVITLIFTLTLSMTFLISNTKNIKASLDLDRSWTINLLSQGYYSEIKISWSSEVTSYSVPLKIEYINNPSGSLTINSITVYAHGYNVVYNFSEPLTDVGDEVTIYLDPPSEDEFFYYIYEIKYQMPSQSVSSTTYISDDYTITGSYSYDPILEFSEDGIHISQILDLYNDQFMSSSSLTPFNVGINISTLTTRLTSGGIVKYYYQSIGDDPTMDGGLIAGTTIPINLPNRDIVFDYPRDLPPPQITQDYATTINLIDLDTGKFWVYKNNSNEPYIEIAIPQEAATFTNLIIEYNYYNPPSPGGTSPEDMWNAGYLSGYSDGIRDNEIDIEQAYEDGKRDGMQASQEEAYQQGFNDGANESFLGNFDKWIVPAIIVVMFVGGFFAVVRMKRDSL